MDPWIVTLAKEAAAACRKMSSHSRRVDPAKHSWRDEDRRETTARQPALRYGRTHEAKP